MKKIGKYDLIREIGHGMTATVYLGFDPFAQREVAIKVASPEILRHPEKGKLYTHLFLNEAYDMPGVTRTKAGQVVGWLYDTEDGDQFVDFGLERVERQVSSAFGNTIADGFCVELNVDGVIYDKI